jgi:hypothetical protein
MSYVTLRVECYSGWRADERPIRFWIDDHSYFVEEIIDQWYGPDAAFFKVRADDRNQYILRHDTSPAVDVWRVESFRQAS